MNIDGMKVQILMGKSNLSIKELAEKSQISRQTISYIRSGKRCTPVTACKIAAALGVNVEDILAE